MTFSAHVLSASLGFAAAIHRLPQYQASVRRDHLALHHQCYQHQPLSGISKRLLPSSVNQPRGGGTGDGRGTRAANLIKKYDECEEALPRNQNISKVASAE
jgi:hypothetical protein